MRLAEQYMDLGRDVPAPPPVDLEAVLAADLAARAAGPEPEPAPPTTATEAGAPDGTGPAPDADRGPVGLLGTLLGGTADAARRPAGLLRRLAADAMLAAADPARVPEWGEEAWATVRNTLSQLDPNGPGAQSPLWGRRSRRRVLRSLSVDLERTRAAAKALGVSINDLFVAGAALAAAAVHRDAGLTLDQVTITFVVSTRHDAETAGNAFTPAKVTIPTGTDEAGTGTELAPFARLVSDALAAGREQVSAGGGLLATLSGLINLLPTSLVTRLARAQAQAVDFATSNLRAAPFPVFIAGAQVLATYPVGPVAGTAFNLTMMSYVDRAYLGVHIDPAAVAEPDALVRALDAAYARLLAAAPPEPPPPGPEVTPRPARAKRARKAPEPDASKPAARRRGPDRRPPATPRPRANRRSAGGA
ncbi:MAG: WS/DGAT domain-containing protein [Acidimicrobiales bacterium]